ncbi:MAG: N-acetyltransferase [Gemmatimonadetes bacterium]|nr:N-acetyltransferase [Gemmatimonadota bacterium]
MIRVEPVRSRAERRAFIDLPFRLYRADPLWVPPLRSDVAELLDPRRHPFHRHARMQLFLARSDGGRVTGRIAAIRNEAHLRIHDDGAGFFGFFETERDPSTARALFDAAGAWLRESGLRVMRGPASPSTNEECGLLVRGFDSPPVVMMPYNPAWYAELLEGYGFRKAMDLLAYYRGHAQQPERLVRMAEALARRHRIVIRPLDKSRFAEEVELVRSIYNAAWEKNWGFVPMTAEEFDHLARKLKQVVDPDLVAFAEVDGKLAGFALGLPDLNRALRHMGGSLWPFGWLKGLWHSRGIDTFRVLTLGILEEYRKTGAAEMMYLYLLRTGPPKGITKGEFSWILEDNATMRAGLEKLGADLYKVYRMYDLPLDA